MWPLRLDVPLPPEVVKFVDGKWTVFIHGTFRCKLHNADYGSACNIDPRPLRWAAAGTVRRLPGRCRVSILPVFYLRQQWSIRSTTVFEAAMLSCGADISDGLRASEAGRKSPSHHSLPHPPPAEIVRRDHPE